MTIAQPTSRKQIYPVLLLALLVAAAGLRFYKLNQGLWLDEILTYTSYARMPYAQIVTTFDSENQHFLYSLLARTSFLLFGESAWALRLPAVLFGVGSILALYLLGREVTDRREALLSAALLTFSYHHIWFSQNARGYTGLLFWTILSSWLLVRSLRRPTPLNWSLYALSVALGMYTHMTMGFVVVGQFLVALAALLVLKGSGGRAGWLGLVIGFGLAGLLTLLIHLPVLPAIRNTVGGSEVSVVATWKSPLWTLMEIVRGLRIGFAGGVIGIGALAVFCAGLVSYARSRPEVLGLLILPPVIGATVTLAIGHHLWPRFFFFAMGFGALVVLRGVMVVGGLLAGWLRLAPNRSAWVGRALALGLIAASALSVPFVYGPKQDHEGALQFIEANRQPGDVVVTVGLASKTFQRLYDIDWKDAPDLETLNNLRGSAERAWLLYSFPPVLESVQPEIMASIQQDFVIVEQFRGTVEGGTIFVCRADRPTATAGSTSLP
jgi:4-amino-4-deoxy-L-arabinose transferase-like glycosyltransferase